MHGIETNYDVCKLCSRLFLRIFNHCDVLSCLAKSVFHQKSNELDFGTDQNKKGMFTSENVPPCNTVRFGAQGVALGSDVAHHCSSALRRYEGLDDG